MSTAGQVSTIGVSKAFTSSSSSDQVRTTVLNLSYPTRPSLYTPWACPPKPLIIRPTISDRYEATFVYSNGSSGLVGHNVQTNASPDIIEYGALKWMKRVVSQHLSGLRHKIRLVKTKILVAPLWRRRS